MNRLILAAALAVAAIPAHAALPDAAYAGPLWDRIVGGVNCTVHTFRNPELIVRPNVTDALFGKDHLHAGQYTYYDAVVKKCVQGGAVSGPQF